MNEIVTSDDLGTRLCRALGLELTKVTNLHIDIEWGDVVMVRADMLMTDAESGELVEMAQDYRLVLDGISDAAIAAIGEQWLEDDSPQGVEPVGLLRSEQ